MPWRGQPQKQQRLRKGNEDVRGWDSMLSRRFSRLLIALCIWAALPAIARATVTLPSLFSDGMVLQRNMPVHIWGKASKGERVSLSFRGETKSALPDVLGYWNIYL